MVMDLISMFTADAAAKHGHEFSNPAQAPSSMPSYTNQNARPRFPHNALLFPVRARPNTAVRRRERPQSMKITMAELKEEREPEDEEEELRRIEEKIRSFTIPGAFLESPAGSARNSEERVEVNAEEGRSVTPSASPKPLPEQDGGAAASRSTGGQTSTGLVARETSEARTASRAKVVFRLGRPVRKKAEKYIRPRCLLQVQDTDAKSHGPIFDVVPGSRVNATTKLGKKLRRLRRNKDGTGADDLIVVRSEHSCAEEKDESEDEVDQEHATFKGQEVIGMIQPAEAGLSANITLGETIWQASLDRNGYSYTLENANDAAQRARWYVPKSKRTAALNGSPREFNFVYMRPGTKRHAVIANMSEGHMEFCEEYVAPQTPDEVSTTDEAMRKLIVVSGLWVYFCEGWSRHYDFQTAVPAANAAILRPGMCRSLSARSGGRKPLKDILRTPSGSPAPSFRCAASVSSDTRSRDGSHDSAATTAVTTPSVAGTVVKRRPASCINTAPAQLESPLLDPAAPERGRRRFSSITTHVRRFSYHIKHRKDRKDTSQWDDEVLTTPILTPTGLFPPINAEEYELHTPLRNMRNETLTVVISSSETIVDADPSTPLPKPKFVIHDPPQHQAPHSMSTATFITAASRPSSSQQATPHVDGIVDQPEPIALPHRLGLGDLTRPKEVFTQHTRTISRGSTSSSDGDTPLGGSGWWSDYGKMILGHKGSVVVPTS